MDVPVSRRNFLRVSLLASSTAVTGGILAACAAPPPPAASKSDAGAKPAIDAAAKPTEAPAAAAKPADAKPTEAAAKPAAAAPTAAAQPAAAAKPAEKAAAAAPVAAPAAQGQVITWKWQSAFGNTDIFHQMGVDLIQKIDEMSGGRLKIDLLPNGAVVPVRPDHRRHPPGPARRRHRRAGLLVRQEQGAQPLGDRPVVRHGRRDDDRLGPVRRRRRHVRASWSRRC